MTKNSSVLKQLLYSTALDVFDGQQGATPFVFGSGQKTSNFDQDQNMKPFINPFSGQRSGFLYGKQDLKFGLEWLFSDSLIFKYLLGKMEASGNTKTYTFLKALCPVLNFVSVDQSDAVGGYWERVKNAICSGITLSSSINNELSVKGNFMGGNYDSNSDNTYDAIAQPTDTLGKPMMFSNVSIIGVGGAVLAAVQSFDLTLNNSGFVDYGMGSKDAITVGKEELAIGGKLTLRYKDGANAKYVNDRVEKTSLVIRLTEGTRVVTLTFGGIGLGKVEKPTIGEAKIVDEVVSFEARTLIVTDTTT